MLMTFLRILYEVVKSVLQFAAYTASGDRSKHALTHFFYCSFGSSFLIRDIIALVIHIFQYLLIC